MSIAANEVYNLPQNCHGDFHMQLKKNCVRVNIYCPECPPGSTIGHPGGQQKKFLPFCHGWDLAAFKGTGLQNKSFRDRAEISKASA